MAISRPSQVIRNVGGWGARTADIKRKKRQQEQVEIIRIGWTDGWLDGMKKERYESKFEFKQKGKERNKTGESESEYQQLHSRVVKMAREVSMRLSYVGD